MPIPGVVAPVRPGAVEQIALQPEVFPMDLWEIGANGSPAEPDAFASAADYLLIFDTSARRYRKLAPPDLIHDATALTTPAAADELAIYDADTALFKRITLANLAASDLFEAGGFEPEDMTLSANKTQRVIFVNDLTITASITITCDAIICLGNFVVNSGVTVTFDNPVKTLGQKGSIAFGKQGNTDPASGAYGGGGAWGGNSGLYGASVISDGGGGSLAAAGGYGAYYSSGGGGGQVLGGAAGNPGPTIGGAGGNGSADTVTGLNGGGGGGAGPGGAGGALSTADGGKGGGSVLILVRGNVTINATAVLSAAGTNGGSVAAGGGGGGGGGFIGIVCYGTFTNSGTITCAGGAGGAGSSNGNGGGGGGGHIEIFAPTATFGILTVTGGTGPGGATNGATGTTQTVNTSSATIDTLFWSEDADGVAGFMLSIALGAIATEIGIFGIFEWP